MPRREVMTTLFLYDVTARSHSYIVGCVRVHDRCLVVRCETVRRSHRTSGARCSGSEAAMRRRGYSARSAPKLLLVGVRICMCMCVCMCVCMYLYLYVCTCACMSDVCVCMHVRMYVCTHESMYVCTHIPLYSLT